MRPERSVWMPASSGRSLSSMLMARLVQCGIQGNPPVWPVTRSHTKAMQFRHNPRAHGRGVARPLSGIYLMNIFVRRLGLATLLSPAIFAAQADNTAQTLPFSQNWTTTTQIAANDNWSGVPGIEGYLGQDITTTTGTDPQTLTGVSASGTDLSVLANQVNTTISNGDVAEFDGIANPTIALQASGTADAPYLLINLDTTGQSGINVAYKLRDLDATTDNAVMPVALQYRV